VGGVSNIVSSSICTQSWRKAVLVRRGIRDKDSYSFLFYLFYFIYFYFLFFGFYLFIRYLFIYFLQFSKSAVDNGRSTLSFVSCPQETDENAVLCPFFLYIHPYIANHSCKTPHSSASWLLARNALFYINFAKVAISWLRPITLLVAPLVDYKVMGAGGVPTCTSVVGRTL